MRKTVALTQTSSLKILSRKTSTLLLSERLVRTSPVPPRRIRSKQAPVAIHHLADSPVTPSPARMLNPLLKTLPILPPVVSAAPMVSMAQPCTYRRSEEHTSELQSRG